MAIMNSSRRLGRLLCLSMLAFRGLSAAANDGAVAAPSVTGAEALEWAYRFGAAIPAEPHLTERSACQYAALKAFLDLGCIEAAAQRVGEIGNWRRGVLYSDLAVAYAQREGASLMLRHCLEAARLFRDGLDGHNAGWQKDRITAYIATALAKAGLADEATAALAGVQDPVAAQVQIEALARIDSDDDYAQTMQQLGALGAAPAVEAQEAAVRAYGRILANHGREFTPARLDEIAAAIAVVIPKLPALLQTPLRTATGRALLVAGQRERGLAVLRDTLTAMTARGLDARFDIVNLADLATVYTGPAAEATQATALLTQAATLLQASALERSERAAALVALGAGYVAVSDQEGAWRYFQQALTYASQQVNGRPRHVMLTDLCVAIGRARHDLPADVRQALDREWNRRGDPW